MKNILYIGLVCASALTFTACVNEEGNLFDKSAAERLNEASELYSSRLTASSNGWAVQLYPTTNDETPKGNGYLVLLRFHANKSVDAATYTYLRYSTTEQTVWEYLTDTSSWDVITDDGPVLTFNTYNDVIHLFSDPEDIKCTGTSTTPNDETGKGLEGDYEFIIVDAPDDASYMMLKGKKRGTYNLLTPIEEGVDYQSYLMDIQAFKEKMFPASTPSFDVLHVHNAQYKVEGAEDGLPTIYPYDEDAVIKGQFNPFLITKRGNDYYLRFRDVKSYNNGQEEGDPVSYVQEFKYVEAKDAFVSTDDEQCYITGDSPSRFFKSVITSASTQWRWTDKSNMSDAYKSIIGELESQLTNVKYSFTRFAVVPTNDGFVLRFVYTYNRKEYSVDYDFIYESSDDGIITTFIGAADTRGENALKAFPALQKAIDALQGAVNVTAAQTSFDLTNLRFTSGSNSGIWYDVTMYTR